MSQPHPLAGTYALPLASLQAFLRRQAEVSEAFSSLSRRHFLTPELLWGEILEGRLRDNFDRMLGAASDRFCDDVAFGPSGQLALTVLLGREAYVGIRRTIARVMVRAGAFG